MHHPLYWTQRYIMYKVTTKKKKRKKISIAHNSLQLNLPFMRSDPQSNQRYETDPINYINTWMRAFVCLKLFSLWDMKNEELTQRLPFSSITEKRKRILTSYCFFSFLPLFLTVRPRNSVTQITPFYPVLCSSDFSDKCHSDFFINIKENWRTDGNRTRASRLVSENCTTEPPVPCWANRCLNEDTLVKCIWWKKQGTKGHTNNPAVSAVPWSGTPSLDDDIIPS